MNVNKSLFLHYGPGGNSDVEKFFLSKKYPQIYFWNQPHTMSFLDLVEASCAAYLKLDGGAGSTSIIGHSFGCDLAVAVAKRLKVKQNILLVAPVYDLESAFRNLAVLILKQKQLTPEVEKEIRHHLERHREDPKLKCFWDLVFSLYKYPQIGALFWKNQAISKKYFENVAQFSPVNLQTWQTILASYIGVEAKATYEAASLKTLNLSVLAGVDDPYFDADSSRKWWTSKIGPQQFQIADQSAHYPHLEDEAAFIELI